MTADELIRDSVASIVPKVERDCGVYGVTRVSHHGAAPFFLLAPPPCA